MSIIEVNVETAFDVGVKEGRRQMGTHIIEMMRVTNDVSTIERYIKSLMILTEDLSDIKGLIKDAKNKN